MDRPQIEYANDRSRTHITKEFVEGRMRWQSTPEGQRALREQEVRSAAAAARARGFVKFPELVGCAVRAVPAQAPAETPRINGWRRMFEILS